jgi:hypothetical protein
MMRQRVEERVGRSVVRLTRAAEHAGEGGEEDEGCEVERLGELVQMEGSIDLGAQDGVQPLWGERVEDAIVERAGGMENGRQRVLVGDRGHELFERVSVSRVAGGEGDASAGGLEVALQGLGARSRGPLARGEKQVLDAVLLHQMPGDQGAERASAARDEDRAVRVEGTRPCLGAGANRVSRGTRRCPSRRASWGSAEASAAGSARREASRSSISTRRMERSGFSAWAERTRPQSGAWTRSRTSSAWVGTPRSRVPPSGWAAMARWVSRTRREEASRSSASQVCRRASAFSVASWAVETTSVDWAVQG